MSIILPSAPHIWTKRPKILEPKDPINVTTGMAGEFRLQVRRSDGSLKLDTGFFPNLITNAGLNIPGTGIEYNAISVGVSNTAPQFTDTTLSGRVATTSSSQGNTAGETGTPGDPDWYRWITFTRRFNQGAAAGNLAEIGVTLGASPWTTYSRALILDGAGNPTTITVLESEFLDATYRHRWYAGEVLDDVNTTINISDVEYDVVLRRSQVTGGAQSWRPAWGWRAGGINYSAYSGDIGSIDGAPSGTIGNPTTITDDAYSNGSYGRSFSAFFPLNNANFGGGIKSFHVRAGTGSGGGSAAAAYQFSVTPTIPKNANNILTMNARQTWARRSL